MRTRLLLFAIGLMGLCGAASAQEREVPYWATIRASELNLRVGPSREYPVDWVYHRQGLPMKVLRVVEGWRLVQDPGGAQGWVVARLLSPDRGALVVGEGLVPMREEPESSSALKWNLEPGVVGRLGDCENGWCRLDVGGHSGWVQAESLWGDGDP